MVNDKTNGALGPLKHTRLVITIRYATILLISLLIRHTIPILLVFNLGDVLEYIIEYIYIYSIILYNIYIYL